MTRYVWVVRYGGAERRFGDVSGVFDDPESAADHWHYVTRDLGNEKCYYTERWPVGVPLYDGRDYLWPPEQNENETKGET